MLRIAMALLLVTALAACDMTTDALAPAEEGLISAAAISSFWTQDFSTDFDGWSDSTNGWYGTITVAGGTATMEGDSSSAPFSRFDMYRDTWTGDYIAEIDVYLDTTWAEDTGFDYSVASSKSDGTHLRDFIFHVGVTGGNLLVNGSNNADFSTNSSKLLNDNGGNYFTVVDSGWYTLQHSFQNVDDVLSVDLNLLDADGNVLWTATRTSPADTIPSVVGGNRYAWFTHIDVAGGIEVDNHELYQVVPGPGTIDDCKQGGWEAYGYKNQGQCVASVVANENSGH